MKDPQAGSDGTPKLEGYGFSPRYFTLASGHRLHYVEEGSGPVVVFVHGNPTWSFYWRHLLNKLKEKYRVIAPDHLGCGLSDKPADYDYILENHIANLTELLTARGVKDATLVLHDWGGAIGMGYAERCPQTVKRLILSNTAAFTSKRMPLRLSLCRLPLFGKLAIQGFNAFAWGATRLATTRGLSAETRRGYLYPYRTFANRIATYQFVQDIPLTTHHRSWKTLTRVEAGLAQFKDRPALFLWGAKDWVFTPEFLHEWRERFPQAQWHLYPDAGHYVLEDAREDYLNRTCRFLEQTNHAL